MYSNMTVEKWILYFFSLITNKPPQTSHTSSAAEPWKKRLNLLHIRKFSVAVVQQKYSVFWAWMKRNIVILYHEMYANRFFVWNFLFQTYYRFEPNNGFQDTWNLFEKYMLFPRCVEEVLELLCFIFFIYFIFLFQVWAWQRPDRVPRCVGQVLELHLGWSTMR